MYRAALESILGFDLRGDAFRMKPKVPGSWNEFSFTYRRGGAEFNVKVLRSNQSSPPVMDGVTLPDEWVPLVMDGKKHDITIYFG
jgi:cellobiose phosphorylase